MRNSVALIKFDLSTAEARRLKPSRATAVARYTRGYTAVARHGFNRRATAMPNSLHKLEIH